MQQYIMTYGKMHPVVKLNEALFINPLFDATEVTAIEPLQMIERLCVQNSHNYTIVLCWFFSTLLLPFIV